MLQLGDRERPVEERRFQLRVAGERALHARRVDPAAGALREQLVAADVVGVRVGVEDRLERPAFFLQYPEQFLGGVAVVAAVDQADVAVVEFEQPDP